MLNLSNIEFMCSHNEGILYCCSLLGKRSISKQWAAILRNCVGNRVYRGQSCKPQFHSMQLSTVCDVRQPALDMQTVLGHLYLPWSSALGEVCTHSQAG